jgi:hypothetical protein
MAIRPNIKPLMPESNLSYYETTNVMHCGPGEGGSKFDDPRVKNIIDVVEMREDLKDKVAARKDDRDRLRELGASEQSFLPATKGADAPEGLPEALYYIVEGVEGRLGVTQLKDLQPETRVLVRREKGKSDPKEKTYAPVSFTVINGSKEDMPKTDFATIIVGRNGGAEGKDEVWTVHPGAPVRPAMKEFPWTADLRSPEEVPAGEKQEVRVMTVQELLEKADLGVEDYVKIVPGDFDKAIEQYRVGS